MISRIELHNFMSHSCTVIQPAAGLTVLVGPNNCGKSAVVSALQILCGNDRGDYMVRHGEDECRIVVVTEDGHRIEWRRKKAVVSYNIDGDDVYRLQGDIPADLHKILRLPKVEAGDGHDYDIHFGVQKDPIFLLNEPGSRAATFFASSSDASKLVEMQKLHRQKGMEARRDEARLAAQAEKLKRRLDILEPVTDLEQAIARASNVYVELIDLHSRLNALITDRDAIRHSLGEVARLEAEAGAVAGLASPPLLSDTTLLEATIQLTTETASCIANEKGRIHAMRPLAEPPILVDPTPMDEIVGGLEHWTSQVAAAQATLGAMAALRLPPRVLDLRPLEALCTGIENCEAECETLSAQQRSLELLAQPPEMADTGPLVSLIEGLETAEQLMMEAGRPLAAMTNFAEPPGLDDEQPLYQMISELERANTAKMKLRQAWTTLKALASPPSPIDVAPLSDLIAEMEALGNRLTGPLRNEVSDANESVEAIISDLREWAKRNRVCPTCGAELDPERIERFVTSGAGKHQHG
jgi:exonuclease SbcC